MLNELQTTHGMEDNAITAKHGQLKFVLKETEHQPSENHAS